MKIIDILNKIANGEEVAQEITDSGLVLEEYLEEFK